MKTRINGRELTFGTDVEGALYHKGIRKYIPATEFNTPFDKEKRFFWEDGASYHRDNITVEYQTTVCETARALAHAIATCQKRLQLIYQPLGMAVHYEPVITYDTDDMVRVPEAAEMGCDPDICAYDGLEKEGPDATDMGRKRAFSGHIHIGGVSYMTDEQKRTFVKWLDYLVGFPLALDESQAGDVYTYRRQWYGQAGRYRNKPYGIEYRTPSNLWTNSVVAHRRAPMLENIQQAVDLTDLGKQVEDSMPMADLRRVIDFTANDDMMRWDDMAYDVHHSIAPQAKLLKTMLLDLGVKAPMEGALAYGRTPQPFSVNMRVPPRERKKFKKVLLNQPEDAMLQANQAAPEQEGGDV